MKKLIFACSFAFIVISGSALADGNVSCDAPKDQWRPRNDLAKELKSKGWSIQKFQIYNGCYEIYGYDDKEKFVEAYFNPQTFERVYTKPE